MAERPAASLALVLIEQLGSLLYLGLSVLAMQYLYTTHLEHRPEDAWVLKAWQWWQQRRYDAEQRRLAIWTVAASSEEPSRPPAS